MKKFILILFMPLFFLSNATNSYAFDSVFFRLNFNKTKGYFKESFKDSTEKTSDKFNKNNSNSFPGFGFSFVLNKLYLSVNFEGKRYDVGDSKVYREDLINVDINYLFDSFSIFRPYVGISLIDSTIELKHKGYHYTSDNSFIEIKAGFLTKLTDKFFVDFNVGYRKKDSWLVGDYYDPNKDKVENITREIGSLTFNLSLLYKF